MRLAQLARKLLIRPSEIVDFLTERSIQIEDGLNTRLEDSHVALIMQKFAPARAAEVAAELAIEKEAEVKKIEEEKVEEKTPEVLNNAEDSSAVNEPSPEKPELIKAPKVELSGLKVLGKIELPQPKKKEIPASTEEIAGDQQPNEERVKEVTKEIPQRNPERRGKENRKPYPNKKESSERPRVNPIALQREREALEAEKRRRAKVKEEKEKRTQHYLKKVKVVAPTKSVKLIQEEVEEMKPLAPVPKTWWGRFMRWLNT